MALWSFACAARAASGVPGATDFQSKGRPDPSITFEVHHENLQNQMTDLTAPPPNDAHPLVLHPNVAWTVSLVLEKEPETPKCFTDTKKDFTCFWEEDEERAGSPDQYSFTYAYR